MVLIHVVYDCPNVRGFEAGRGLAHVRECATRRDERHRARATPCANLGTEEKAFRSGEFSQATGENKPALSGCAARTKPNIGGIPSEHLTVILLEMNRRTRRRYLASLSLGEAHRPNQSLDPMGPMAQGRPGESAHPGGRHHRGASPERAFSFTQPREGRSP